MNKTVSIALFAGLLLIGVTLYKDYGISWDETMSRTNGVVSLNYIAERFDAPWIAGHLGGQAPALHAWVDRDYPVAFELPLAWMEVVLDLRDSRQIYELRHLMTFLVWLAGAYAVYRMARLRFPDSMIGIVAVLFYVLHPRLFAESFYNDKDVVFMAAFALAMYASVLLVIRPSYRFGLLAALLTAIAIDVRIMGVLLPVLTLFFVLVYSTKVQRPPRILGVATVYLVLTGVFVVSLWPFLWDQPIHNFVVAFKNMSRFGWEGLVLFNGRYLMSTDLPWYYSLTWIAITTPLWLLVLLVIGLMVVLARLMTRDIRSWGDDEVQDVFYLAALGAPLLAVMVLHSVLYDGWRQLYFVFPAMVLVALRGLRFVQVSLLLRFGGLSAMVFWVVMSAPLIATVVWMVKEHPSQYLYFNALAGDERLRRWEMDYWGIGNRDAIQYILDRDGRSSITLRADSYTSLETSLLMVEEGDRDRIRLVGKDEDADYVLTNYRWVLDKSGRKYADGYDHFWGLTLDGETVINVYKRRG